MINDELFECWDYVRSKEVVTRNKDNLWDYFYGLMLDLGYFSRGVINNDNMKVEGYQLNSGLGRSYSLEGTSNVQ